jgi:hypothetical protein
MQPLPRLSFNAAGEIVLSKALQEALHLHAGMPLLVSVEDNRLCLQPMNAGYLAGLCGSLKEAESAFTLAALHTEKGADQILEDQKRKRFQLHRR